MTGNHNSNESMSKRHQWYWMCEGRSSRIFWGIFFIVVGLFWLGKKAGWFSLDFTILFWPLVVIMIGVVMIVAALIRRRNPC